MNEQIIPIVIAVLPTILAIVLWLQLNSLKKKFSILTGGKQDKNLTELIRELKQTLDTCKSDMSQTRDLLAKFERENTKHIQKIGLVRFQGFKDTGGDQSFSLALLDKEDNGLMITSLAGRDFIRVTAKELEKGQPKEHKLTEEEIKAVKKAVE